MIKRLMEMKIEDLGLIGSIALAAGVVFLLISLILGFPYTKEAVPPLLLLIGVMVGLAVLGVAFVLILLSRKPKA